MLFLLFLAAALYINCPPTHDVVAAAAFLVAADSCLLLLLVFDNLPAINHETSVCNVFLLLWLLMLLPMLQLLFVVNDVVEAAT